MERTCSAPGATFEHIEADLRWLAREPQRQAEMLDAVFAASPCRIYVTDSAGRYVYVSLPGARLLGLDRGAMLGRTWREAGLPAGAMEPLDALQQRVFATGQSATGEMQLRSAEGLRDYQYVIDPVRLPDGRIVAVNTCLQDITERKRAEEQREDILRAVSHDLRNPLAAVLGQAELLKRQLEPAGTSRQALPLAEAIITTAQRMNTMIQELVDATRLESGQLVLNRQPIYLPSFVLDLRRRLAPTLDMSRVRVEAPTDLPAVLADPDRLERILTNLLSNALKYSTPGTPVTVSFARRDGEVVTSVTDRGPGIAPEELPHLFERYFRTRAAREQPEGLGLGLYITRRLVEAHGGRIWVESEAGVGSTFYVALPAA